MKQSRTKIYLYLFFFPTYRCDEGYALVGEAEATCLANGRWNHSSPFCELVQCPLPKEIKNGKYIMNGVMYLSNVSYTCDVGYR